MSARRLVPALWLVALTGCAHPAPPPRSASCPPSPAPVVPTPVAAAPVTGALPAPVRELTWKLRISDRAEWTPVPTTLHTFSLPRWECALGEPQDDGATADSQAPRWRTRRLACTHRSGITVQTRLDCPIEGAALPAGREIELSLDTLPPLRVACETVVVARAGTAKANSP